MFKGKRAESHVGENGPTCIEPGSDEPCSAYVGHMGSYVTGTTPSNLEGEHHHFILSSP